MATYYRWNQNTIGYEEYSVASYRVGDTITINGYYLITIVRYHVGNRNFVLDEIGGYRHPEQGEVNFNSGYMMTFADSIVAGTTVNNIYKANGSGRIGWGNSSMYKVESGSLTKYGVRAISGSFQSYVYSISSSTYPTNGQSGSYWYNNQTTVTSPTNPSQISYPSTINTLSTTITWQPATSNTSYPVSRYELSYSTNGGSSWQVAGTTTETTYQFGISSPEVTQIQFRVRAMDTNSQYSDYVTGSNSTVQYVPANPPVLVLPDNAKLGDTITISWNSVIDATNYILQRKVDGGEWTQIYSGANLSTTNLVDNLGISYRIAFNVGSNFTSEWSQEYKLNTYEKLIEMTYLGDDGNYMPLYPRTVSSAVVNAGDLINTVSLSGTYQGNGFETNSVALENSVDPKVAIITNSKQETTLVTNFNENNMTVKESNNELGETYSYVIIGNNKSK